MGRVVHFEFPVDDPDRAAKFFEQVFGWNIKQWEGGMPYWLVGTGDRAAMGIDGGFTPRSMNPRPFVNIIHVEDIDAAIAAVEGAGGKIVQPKGAIPQIGQIAYFTDTEGNVWGMLEPDMEGMQP
jgi:uncharacterized protein